MSNVDAEANLESMIDDPDAWDVPSRAPKKKSEQRKRGAMVSVRLTPNELAVVQRAAEREGMSLSNFMRSRALNSATNHRPAFGQPPRNTTFFAADNVWRSDVEVEVSQYVRQPMPR